MDADTPEAPASDAVCVFPFENGWTIGFCGGHFAIPVTREKAISEAVRLAKEANLAMVTIRTATGKLLERLKLADLPGEAFLPLEITGNDIPLDIPCECEHLEECKKCGKARP